MYPCKPEYGQYDSSVDKTDSYRKTDTGTGPDARGEGKPLDTVTGHKDRAGTQKSHATDGLRSNSGDIKPPRIKRLKVLL